MGFVLGFKDDKRFIVTYSVTVRSIELARVFETKKQVVNFINEHQLDKEDYLIYDQNGDVCPNDE